MIADIQPFKLAVPEAALKTLKTKLELTTFPRETDFSNDWTYGAPLRDVQRLANYWKDGFDWRAQEAKINELPQFTTKVGVDNFGDLELHFIHQRSSNPDSIPLLFCHGWPGSFLEAVKILPLLTEPADGPSFHVVAPSLPNFGFSQGVQKKDFALPQYAESVHKLMLKLGYDKYVTQGGDWGFAITRLVSAQYYPDHCVASHLNFVRVHEPPKLSVTPWQYIKHALLPYAAHEKEGIARTKWIRDEGMGYNWQQSTKPATIGFALTDSPVALLAWIYEKLHDWTDSYPWTDDEILTWVSVYQFSRAGPAGGCQIYYEATHTEPAKSARLFDYLPIPIGLSCFPKDIVVPPRTWGRSLGNIVFEKMHSDGGHFSSHERPDELVQDLREMFGKGGGAQSVALQFASKH